MACVDAKVSDAEADAPDVEEHKELLSALDMETADFCCEI